MPTLPSVPAPLADAGPVRTRRHWLGASGSLLLAACAGTPVAPPDEGPAETTPEPPPQPQVVPFSQAGVGLPPSTWRPYAIRRDLARTRYRVVRDGGRHVLHAQAASSATGLVCGVDIDPLRRPVLQFSWRASEVPARANVAEAVLDDCPARIFVAFGGDETRMPLRERLFFEQVELFTGRRLPYATLMYVWDGGSHPVESVHRNHRTTRIQYLAVESGSQRSGRWLQYRRNLADDFQRVFGEAPGPVLGVGVLTDADALKTRLEAWYGDITLSAA